MTNRREWLEVRRRDGIAEHFEFPIALTISEHFVFVMDAEGYKHHWPIEVVSKVVEAPVKAT